MRTLAIMNLKGGTAKTVTAINTAAILARDYGERVLLVDADSQYNLTEFVTGGSLPDGVSLGSLADLLTGGEAFPTPTQIPNVDLLHAPPELMALDVTSTKQGGSADPMALRDWLAGRADRYDRCIIDCPPAFSAAAMAALIAADDVLIPIKLDAFGVRGVQNLREQVRNMQKINRGLEIAGVLPTMYYKDDSQNAALAALRKQLVNYGIRVFRPIRRSTKVDGMTFAQTPIIVSSPKSAAAVDYKAFAAELIRTEGGEQDGV